MAKRSLEEMLNDSENRNAPSDKNQRGGRKRNFTKQEKTRLAIYWTVLVVCLAGFILMLIFLLNNNPVSRSSAEIGMPSCTYKLPTTITYIEKEGSIR